MSRLLLRILQGKVMRPPLPGEMCFCTVFCVFVCVFGWVGACARVRACVCVRVWVGG